LEDGAGGSGLRDLEPRPGAHPPGVYPVLREDASFLLQGSGAFEVMAQVCNVNFADLDLAGVALPGAARPDAALADAALRSAARPGAARPDAARPDAARPGAARPLIMTSMVGVSVLVVPSGSSFRIWCDPTFGNYLGESLRQVVGDCGGMFTGESG
jgi:hypothetical protein